MGTRTTPVPKLLGLARKPPRKPRAARALDQPLIPMVMPFCALLHRTTTRCAMQKVVGSSPIIRFTKALLQRRFGFLYRHQGRVLQAKLQAEGGLRTFEEPSN